MGGGANRAVFLFPRVQLRADKFEIGDSSEQERVQVRGILRAQFRGGEPSTPDVRRAPVENLEWRPPFPIHQPLRPPFPIHQPLGQCQLIYRAGTPSCGDNAEEGGPRDAVEDWAWQEVLGLKCCIGGAPVIFEAVPPFLFLALRGSSQGNVSKMLKLDSRRRGRL